MKSNLINVQSYLDQLEELKVIMNWLIDGYDINFILKNFHGKAFVTKDFIIQYYNVDESCFDKKYEEPIVK